MQSHSGHWYSFKDWILVCIVKNMGCSVKPLLYSTQHKHTKGTAPLATIHGFKTVYQSRIKINTALIECGLCQQVRNLILPLDASFFADEQPSYIHCPHIPFTAYTAKMNFLVHGQAFKSGQFWQVPNMSVEFFPSLLEQSKLSSSWRQL